MNDEQARCGRCRWFWGRGDDAQCRRYPPTAVQLIGYSNISRFPRAHSHQFCGEFTAKVQDA